MLASAARILKLERYREYFYTAIKQKQKQKQKKTPMTQKSLDLNCAVFVQTEDSGLLKGDQPADRQDGIPALPRAAPHACSLETP